MEANRFIQKPDLRIMPVYDTITLLRAQCSLGSSSLPWWTPTSSAWT